MAKASSILPKRPEDQIYRLRVMLPETKPLVWRRVMVPGVFTLEKLHSVLQMAMGWQMSHLYDFEIGEKRYADSDEFAETKVFSLAASLAAAVRDQKSFFYNYDFGDDWCHVIEVEEILARDTMFHYPICLGGENACPPEDCGGFPGFEEIKEKIADPKHSEYKEMMRWLGGQFDPFSFDPNRVNRDFLWLVDWSEEPNDQGLYLPFNRSDCEAR